METINFEFLSKNLITLLLICNEIFLGKTKITMDMIMRSKNILMSSELEMQPKTFMTGRDSIQFEYENGENYLEFELFESHISYYEVLKNDKSDTISYCHGRIFEDKILFEMVKRYKNYLNKNNENINCQ